MPVIENKLKKAFAQGNIFIKIFSYFVMLDN